MVDKISCGGFQLGNGLIQSKSANEKGKFPLQVNPSKVEYIRCKDIVSNVYFDESYIYKKYINLNPNGWAVTAYYNFNGDARNNSLVVFNIENGVNCDTFEDYSKRSSQIMTDEYALQSNVLLDMSTNRMNNLGVDEQIFVGNLSTTSNTPQNIYGCYKLKTDKKYTEMVAYAFEDNGFEINDNYIYTMHGVTPTDVYASVMKFDETDYSTVFNIIVGSINNENIVSNESTYTFLRAIEKDYKTSYFRFHFVNGVPTYVMDDKVVYSIDNGEKWIEVDASANGHCVQSRVYDGELWLCYENGEELKVYKTTHPETAKLQTVIDLTQFEEIYPAYTNIGAHDGNVVVAVNTDNEHMYYIWSIDDGDTWFDGGEIRCQMSNNSEYIGVNNEGNMIWYTHTGEAKLFERVAVNKDGERGALMLNFYQTEDNLYYYTGNLSPQYIINYYADGGKVCLYYLDSTARLFIDELKIVKDSNIFTYSVGTPDFSIIVGKTEADSAELANVKLPFFPLNESL